MTVIAARRLVHSPSSGTSVKGDELRPEMDVLERAFDFSVWVEDLRDTVEAELRAPPRACLTGMFARTVCESFQSVLALSEALKAMLMQEVNTGVRSGVWHARQ